jgi:predicted nucleic-acid-binding protein
VDIAADSNILSRHLIQDDAAQGETATALIIRANKVFVSNVVLCEVARVLQRSYRLAHTEIEASIEGIADSRNVIVDRPAVESGLALLRKGGDFADGVIQYEAERARCDKLFTLDAAFARRSDPAKVALLRP